MLKLITIQIIRFLGYMHCCQKLLLNINMFQLVPTQIFLNLRKHLDNILKDMNNGSLTMV